MYKLKIKDLYRVKFGSNRNQILTEFLKKEGVSIKQIQTLKDLIPNQSTAELTELFLNNKIQVEL